MLESYIFSNWEKRLREEEMRRRYFAFMSLTEQLLSMTGQQRTEQIIITLQITISYYEKIEEYEKCYNMLELSNHLKFVSTLMNSTEKI
jgi:hypothetical protein